METIKLSDIIIKNRQRRHFDEAELQKLSESIRTKGLLHPPVLQNDGRTLVAGERRLRAIKLLYDLDIPIKCHGREVPLGEVPFTRIGELSQDDLMEAELEENVLRQDLTWHEHAQAVKALHELRSRQDPQHTVTATASEILGRRAQGAQVHNTTKEILVAEHLDDPEIATAPSLQEAYRRLRRKVEETHKAQLAEQFSQEKVPHQIFLGKFQDNLPAPGTIDVILTDPPYGINADDFGGMNPAGHGYEDSPEYFREVITQFAEASALVAKPAAHLYCFCDFSRFPYLSELFTSHGWTPWKLPLIWAKNPNFGPVPLPDHSPRRTYECILYAWRGDKPLLAIHPDVISLSQSSRPRFAAEKPPELYLNLLRRSARPGDSLWDPFAGSGPIIPAANTLGATAWASELLEEKHRYILTRLEEKVGDELEELF